MKTKGFTSSIIFITGLFVLLFALPSSSFGHTQELKVKKTKFSIHRGVNIAHWVSQSDVRGESRKKFFTEHEVKQLHEWGFDHLRIPVGEEHIFNDNGTINDEAMNLIENAIAWCKKYDMRVIFDLHNIKSHHFNEKNNTLWTSDEAQKKLCDMWAKLARRLNKYPTDLLAFELLNEPVADKNEDWNKVISKVLPVVRAVNKKRIIIVASNKWNNIDNVPDVKIPDNDPNLMLTFHFYEPFILTHYRGSWTDIRNVKLDHNITYPGKPIVASDTLKLGEPERKIARWWYQQYYDKETLGNKWKKAIEYARKKGVEIYLGEFGCLETGKQSSRVAWVNDISELCNEYNIPRAYWEYKSGFGFADWSTGKLTNPELLKAVIK